MGHSDKKWPMGSYDLRKVLNFRNPCTVRPRTYWPQVPKSSGGIIPMQGLIWKAACYNPQQYSFCKSCRIFKGSGGFGFAQTGIYELMVVLISFGIIIPDRFANGLLILDYGQIQFLIFTIYSRVLAIP